MAKDLDAPLELPVELLYYTRNTKSVYNPKGGRPKESYVVNPAALL